MATNLKTVIDTRITSLEKSEKATHLELAAVSRELLLYVPDSQDIATVNRLMNVLNRPNRELAGLFFGEFLEWAFDDKALTFTKKLAGETKLKRYAEKRTKFLAIEDNNIWTWGRENVAPAKRKIDFEKNLAALIDRATAEKNSDGTPNEAQITPHDVFNVFMNKLTMEYVLTQVMAAAEVAKAEQEKINEKVEKVTEVVTKDEPNAKVRKAA
jgi:hypothetical protein